jgi:hypothetical protein
VCSSNLNHQSWNEMICEVVAKSLTNDQQQRQWVCINFLDKTEAKLDFSDVSEGTKHRYLDMVSYKSPKFQWNMRCG